MGFSNCYLVVNEKTKEVILIDPGKVTEAIIRQLEENCYKLTAILITHNNGSHAQGLKTLTKIYSPKIYGADWDIAGNATNVITGDGKIRIAGLSVRYVMLPDTPRILSSTKLKTCFLSETAFRQGFWEARTQVIQAKYFVQISKKKYFRSKTLP